MCLKRGTVVEEPLCHFEKLYINVLGRTRLESLQIPVEPDDPACSNHTAGPCSRRGLQLGRKDVDGKSPGSGGRCVEREINTIDRDDRDSLRETKRRSLSQSQG
jgi:hypothetical protein